eukprot:11191331-Alexandrium_andersonii.AAC.1
MSASLVGSEMCIRDRSAALQHKDVRQPGDECAGEAPGGLPLPEMLNAGPVSYTHLTLPTICSV